MADMMKDAIERLRNECNVPPSDPTDRVPNLTTDIRAVCDAAEAMVQLGEMRAEVVPCQEAGTREPGWLCKANDEHGMITRLGKHPQAAINAVWEQFEKGQANAAG